MITFYIFMFLWGIASYGWFYKTLHNLGEEDEED